MAKEKSTDEKVMGLIKEINRQKSEIAKAERPAWKTNCSFSYIEGSTVGVTSLHVETNIRNLILIVAFLREREISYKGAAQALGVENAPAFTWNGSPVSEWVDDIRMRITKIQIAEKRKKLEVLEDRLNKIISPDLRAKMELEAIASELG